MVRFQDQGWGFKLGREAPRFSGSWALKDPSTALPEYGADIRPCIYAKRPVTRVQGKEFSLEDLRHGKHLFRLQN